MTRPIQIRLTEIFFSLQGESTRVGMPTVFVRLTGCPLRCGYCDSAYAFYGGTLWRIADILTEVARYAVRDICVTGGEPLAQKNCLLLLSALCDAGYRVSLETSGALTIAEVDPRVLCVVDVKTPGSGEVKRNRWENLALLKPQDELKFVLTDEADYQWACQVVKDYNLAGRCALLFSPAWGQVAPTTLANWIVRDRTPVRLQLQLHKVLWGELQGV